MAARVGGNIYSLPSRLIGERVTVLDRHIIRTLVRKPWAVCPVV